jgi:hypothetical protein
MWMIPNTLIPTQLTTDTISTEAFFSLQRGISGLGGFYGTHCVRSEVDHTVVSYLPNFAIALPPDIELPFDLFQHLFQTERRKGVKGLLHTRSIVTWILHQHLLTVTPVCYISLNYSETSMIAELDDDWSEHRSSVSGILESVVGHEYTFPFAGLALAWFHHFAERQWRFFSFNSKVAVWMQNSSDLGLSTSVQQVQDISSAFAAWCHRDLMTTVIHGFSFTLKALCESECECRLLGSWDMAGNGYTIPCSLFLCTLRSPLAAGSGAVIWSKFLMAPMRADGNRSGEGGQRMGGQPGQGELTTLFLRVPWCHDSLITL